jgi:16S rRNA (uracil1498-N3)-methyltransferase
LLPAGLRSSAAHVIVGSLDAPVLDPNDAHHLSRVLRLRDGEAVTATDGAGRWRVCRFVRGGRDRGALEPGGRDHAALEPDGDIATLPRPSPELTVGFAVMKGDRPEWVVQKLTELGVDRIVPLRTERSVVRWDGERGVAAVERLRRVAREAAMQSRRCWLPSVAGVDVPASFPEAALAEPGGVPITLAHATVLVGPEGGWAPPELAGAAATVSLGELVLRSETAAVAAGTLLGALRSRSVVAPSPVV